MINRDRARESLHGGEGDRPSGRAPERRAGAGGEGCLGGGWRPWTRRVRALRRQTRRRWACRDFRRRPGERRAGPLRDLTADLIRFLFDLLRAADWAIILPMEGYPAIVSLHGGEGDCRAGAAAGAAHDSRRRGGAAEAQPGGPDPGAGGRTLAVGPDGVAGSAGLTDSIDSDDWIS